MSKSWVYILGTSGEEFFVKIGTCRRDPQQRMREIQGGCPAELRMMVVIPGDAKLERRLHETFKPCRIRGEWFHASGKLQDFIYYLLGGATYGDRIVTIGYFESAIADCVLTGMRHPDSNLSVTEYDATADASVWSEFADG